MNEINQLIARLKQLKSTAGYSWWWDEDNAVVKHSFDGGCWCLLLHDGSNTAEGAGYIAIVRRKDGKWGLHAIAHSDEAEATYGTDNLIFVTGTLEEAKRKVDMLLRVDSGEIPLFGNSDPE